ncbi:lipin Ned1 [Savitreella phatthalungensis]
MNLLGRAVGSVSKTWNSINPATLSGAIDVVVVEQENGDLACSPFHVRFGKFQLLRPSEKKVDFKLNSTKVPFPMKLGDGGEAFFVFQTDADVPVELQTSPVVSPVGSPSPDSAANRPPSPGLQDVEPFDLNAEGSSAAGRQMRANSMDQVQRPNSSPPTDLAHPTLAAPLGQRAQGSVLVRPNSGNWDDLATSPGSSTSPDDESTRAGHRRHTVNADNALPQLQRTTSPASTIANFRAREDLSEHTRQALAKAEELMRKLSTEDIPTHITDAGDVMLDMHGYKSNDDDFAQVGSVSDHIAAAEDLSQRDSLVTADEHGNLWIHATAENKRYALSVRSSSPPPPELTDDARSEARSDVPRTPPQLPAGQGATTDTLNYAKTLRLTSDQLKSLELARGENKMSFTVGKSTCTASLFYWRYNEPVVISDIDGTITKSDALGHLFNMVGRDWTHPGVARLYTDIAHNGYHWLYLSSRSAGQADSTRNYLRSIVQDKYKLPPGPVILSPDRTMAALRREMILRKPEVFKMQCLRDLQNLFGKENKPFHAGFGNRITDAISYRYVGVKSSRIFTINSYGDVHMELLQFAGYKSSYMSMQELVDHFFPPVTSQEEVAKDESDYTDFTFWRPTLPQIDFSDEDDDGGEESILREEDDENSDEDPDYAPSEDTSENDRDEGNDDVDDDDEDDGNGRLEEGELKHLKEDEKQAAVAAASSGTGEQKTDGVNVVAKSKLK